MRGTEAVFLAGLTWDFEKNVHRVPAAGRIPILLGLECGHEHFLRAKLVELFANDVLDLAKDAQTQRKPRINAGHLLMDESAL